ncbi:RtcB family protein [Acetobacter sp. TBRC 12305]|uniref:3'-phosphate/5'-hydroxy nucleic acid ligase n=1 Tax=Acetobacter garciniae TaxID=2817435 RepID=A0A939KRY8_9PROT|nr:RtcB family protein [Acetobacter garciniae]MBO1326486.1 RtcB family protein [Acetobacter garciniae]MBX0346198.1 RtcB family protein [Acetobacter garciniae]
MTMTHEHPAPITGNDLIAWGHRPGAGFAALLARASTAQKDGMDSAQIRSLLAADLSPPPPSLLPLRAEGEVPLHISLRAENEDETTNMNKVLATMREVLRTPTVEAGAVMPDACPAGPLGTIPVGGIVATRNAIHPGMHSADICCSVMMTDLGNAEPRMVLDAASAITHFGPGGRKDGNRFAVDPDLLDAFRANPFLKREKTLDAARTHMGTQGDGNHFLFVGRSRSTGHTVMVTHHGSRGPGARLYTSGMEVAERYRQQLSPDTLPQNAWIPADSEDGRAYWQALQLTHRWTKDNHATLHHAISTAVRANVVERFWNEHNFVFERDGLFYHGKGATPAWGKHADDACGKVIIPLNMAEPVLIARGNDAPHALGFAPHGAGRNFTRTEHRRRMGAITAEALLTAETQGLDIRFYGGKVDISELPSSYKRADTVVQQIGEYGLAEIEDYIDPFGCIMAGNMGYRGRRSARRSP